MQLVKEQKIHTDVHKAGGKGSVIIKHFVDEAIFGGANTMFAEITLKPGCEVGYHQHQGNNETYYFTKGTGTYNDNGSTYPVKAGDTTFCADGEAHGIDNTSNEDLVFVALINKTVAK